MGLVFLSIYLSTIKIKVMKKNKIATTPVVRTPESLEGCDEEIAAELEAHPGVDPATAQVEDETTRLDEILAIAEAEGAE
jgi:hypothetical protein